MSEIGTCKEPIVSFEFQASFSSQDKVTSKEAKLSTMSTKRNTVRKLLKVKSIDR